MLIDTHAHLDDIQFDLDRNEVIEKAFASGVKKIINIGAGLRSSEQSVKLANNYKNVFATVGLHPEYFMKHKSWKAEHKNKLESLTNEKKVVAIGEIGLDYYNHGEKISDEEKEFQKEGFIFQLNLAKKNNLPVVIHCRGERAEAGMRFREKGIVYEEVLEIIKEFNELKFVFHSFGGRLNFAEKIIKEANVFFSFNGNISYNKSNSEMFDILRVVPIEKIMLETDCPYLAPVPARGKRNEPAYIKFVAEKLAEIKEEDIEKIKEITTKNANNFFGI